MRELVDARCDLDVATFSPPSFPERRQRRRFYVVFLPVPTVARPVKHVAPSGQLVVTSDGRLASMRARLFLDPATCVKIACLALIAPRSPLPFETAVVESIV